MIIKIEDSHNVVDRQCTICRARDSDLAIYTCKQFQARDIGVLDTKPANKLTPNEALEAVTEKAYRSLPESLPFARAAMAVESALAAGNEPALLTALANVLLGVRALADKYDLPLEQAANALLQADTQPHAPGNILAQYGILAQHRAR